MDLPGFLRELQSTGGCADAAMAEEGLPPGAASLTAFREPTFEKMLLNCKFSMSKRSFLSKKIKYLDYVISAEGITLVRIRKKITMRNWPIPQNKKHLKSFLGFCSYYRKFVKGFSSLAKPLYMLTENETRFVWKEKYQDSFDELKQALTSSPILAFPKIERDILDIDASNQGIGAILLQKQNGKEKVMAYFSRILNKAKKCVMRRENLATQYDFEVIHRRDLLHKNADGLSRRPCTHQCRYCANVELKEATKQESCGKNYLRIGDPCIYLFLPKKEAGKNALYLYWATCKQNVKEWCKTSQICLARIIFRYGILAEVHTDQRRNFESRIYRELSRLLGIKKTRMAPLYPVRRTSGTTSSIPF
ncbi:POL5 protein, partial [Pseudoatta argentina]